MREILFRGKCDEEWIVGDYTSTTDGTVKQHFIIDERRHTYVVDPETVGQYTGLKDKAGRRIFEGDIVKYGDKVHLVVFEQRNNTAYFGLVFSPLETWTFGHYVDLKQTEVIGNVYDNAELLGGAE